MSISFSKWHANGNDFLIAELLSKDFSLTKKQISQIADRNKGIGFDQLILILPPRRPKSDFAFKFFNSDGTQAGNCLNGSRCAIAFIHKIGLSKKDKITVDIKNRSNIFTISNRLVATESLLPVSLKKPVFIDRHLALFKLNYLGFVDIGNKHLIALSKEHPNSIDLPILDKKIRGLKDCREANISVIQKKKDRILIRTSENGVGETLSCGSAAASVAGLVDENTLVIFSPGGTLKTSRTKRDTIILQGPTEHIMECIWEAKKK